MNKTANIILFLIMFSEQFKTNHVVNKYISSIQKFINSKNIQNQIDEILEPTYEFIINLLQLHGNNFVANQETFLQNAENSLEQLAEIEEYKIIIENIKFYFRKSKKLLEIENFETLKLEQFFEENDIEMFLKTSNIILFILIVIMLDNNKEISLNQDFLIQLQKLSAINSQDFAYYVSKLKNKKQKTKLQTQTHSQQFLDEQQFLAQCGTNEFNQLIN